MMKIKFVFIMAGLALHITAFAQVRDSTRSCYPLSRLSIKWSSLHTIDFFSTAQFAVEQRIANKFSVQYDFGVVMPERIDHSRYHSQHGYKAKFQVRYYFKRTRHWAFFFGPEVYYNHVDYQQNGTYLVHAGNYYQYFDNKVNYRERGATLKVGTIFRVRRFCIDFQVGVEGRIVNNVTNMPTGSNYERIEKRRHFLQSTSPMKPDEGSNIQQIRPTFGIRFGYIIL